MTTEAQADAQQAAPTEPTVTEPATPPATTTAPAPGTEQDPPAEDQPTDAKPTTPDPKDRAIRQLAFENRETKRRLREAEERLAAAQPPKDPNAPLTQADVDRMVEERAQALVAHRETTAKANSWIDVGRAEDADFDRRCNEVAELGGDTKALAETLSKIPNAHKIVAELAADPAEAVRVLHLSPVEMALELAGISTRIAANAAPDAEPAPKPVTKPVTQAPAPIKPLATAARAEVDPSTMTSDQYQAYWNKRTRG